MSQTRLLGERRFFPLFWTQFFGAFNDNLLKNALVILITFQAGSVLGIPSAQMVAASGGIFILPFFLFSATAGQLADKYEKTQLIRMIKLAEIAIMILATVGFLTHQFGFLLVVLFFMGLHSTFFGPIKYSILPQHLEEKDLVGGNALIEAGTFLAILLGTICGGVLVAIPEVGPLYVSSALLLVAIAGYLMSLKIPRAEAADPRLTVQWNPVTPTVQILRTTRANVAVFLAILGISWFWFFGAALLSLFPVYCKEILHGGESVVTLFLALFSVGIGVGSMLCEKFSRKGLELGLVPFGSIGLSFFAIDLGLQGHPRFPSQAPRGIEVGAFLSTGSGIHIALILFLLSTFAGFFIVPLYTLMQERSNPAQRSRIIAANNIINAIFMVVASLFLIVMMRLGLDSVQLFLVLGILNAVIAICIYRILPEYFIRFCLWILASVMYRLKIIGAENIPREGPALLVCNHVSFVDWLIIFAAVKRPVRFVMDHAFSKGALMTAAFNQAKVILIAPEHGSVGVLREAMDRIAEELEAGHIVCFFPEGALTRDGDVHPFKRGVERIIARTPVPVIPMALQGLWGSFFSRNPTSFMKRPGKPRAHIRLSVGAPISPKDVTAQKLFEEVKRLMSSA